MLPHLLILLSKRELLLLVSEDDSAHFEIRAASVATLRCHSVVTEDNERCVVVHLLDNPLHDIFHIE